ncbi:hypothetical protein [Aquipuribacter nitratireducens]|uniref:Polyketide cyclase / dehydrase and lipid transport n=1 Tax=Aquipuribacter nitratireducens TaxID=650104 RepID=A0ABW0GQL1_9MICO
MPLVDVVDDTFVRAAPAAVRAMTRPAWEGWLDAGPGARLALVRAEERGVEGVRWEATARTGRGRGSVRWAGTAEVWLEPAWGGTVVHLFVRLDPVPPVGPVGPVSGVSPAGGVPVPARHARRLPDALRRSWKRGLVGVQVDPTAGPRS